jgi:tetratricopeptide (TPR) repeat protein
MDMDVELNHARTAHRKGRIDEAVPIYQRILKQVPEHPHALHLLGVATLQKGDAEKAAELIGLAVSLVPNDARIHNNLGTAYQALRRFEDAVAEFKRSESLDPAFREAPYNLGNCLRLLHRPDDAKAAFRRAIKIAPDHDGAHNNLGALLKSLGQYDLAIAEFAEAHRLAPENREYLSSFVTMLELMNRTDEAERKAEELVRIAPDFPVTRILRARLERRSGNIEAARALVAPVAAATAEPLLQIPAKYELARILDKTGAYATAFGELTEAKKIRLSLPATRDRDLAQYRKSVQAYNEWIPHMPARQGPRASDGLSGPVFFVGFPRSGTTLMEQILGSHSRLVTTNENSPLTRMIIAAPDTIGRVIELPDSIVELTDTEILALRERFFVAARDITGDDLKDRLLVDKLPLNIAKLGIINCVFPDAKVLVALRDPRDVCLSCFFQNFVPNKAMLSYNSG